MLYLDIALIRREGSVIRSAGQRAEHDESGRQRGYF